MPIYGYACTDCNHRFDVLQKISDPKLTDCPACGESALRKELSAPKFRLKGQGWYETDFKTGDKRNIAGEADKSATDSKKDGDTSKTASETKASETKSSETKTSETGTTATKAPSTDSKAKSA